MRAYFLGTNGWYDTKTGNTVCVLIETKNKYVIFDAGNGFYKIDQYVKFDKPIHLFLSHYHLDHIIGLHALNKFNFKQGIDIFGPTGLKTLFKRVINTPYSMPISRLNTRVRLHEIKKGNFLPTEIEYKELKHNSLCYGYRVISDGKVVTYCTDTGICRNLSLLASKADLFITECSLRPGQVDNKWPHLNPSQAAEIASKSKCRELVLIHFDASIYLSKADREDAAAVGRKIFRNTLAAEDGLVIDL
jgi:ribonuclease BN (tRNA processing enzyme)